MSNKDRKKIRPTKLKSSQKTFAGLVKAFERDVDTYWDKLEASPEFQSETTDGDFLLIVGWALSKGMNDREALDFARFVWNETDII